MIGWETHPGAQLEHDNLLEQFGAIDTKLAVAFELCYLQYRHAICDNPLLFNIRRKAVRRANLKPQFSEYYIAYMIWREKVVILAIAHAKRRPYYWRKRIDEAKEMF